jgi:hypothetical protein
MQGMLHRHLDTEGFSLAAIDDLISRGNREDWEQLRSALLASPELAENVRQVCRPNLSDPYAQRYHFWMRYVEERFA